RTDHRSPRASHRTCSLRARRRRAVEVVCQPELDVLLPQVTRRFASCQSTAALLTLSSRATRSPWRPRSRGTPTLRTLSHAVIPSDEVAVATEESRDPYSANALSRCHPERRAQRGVEGPLPCECSLMLSSRATSAARS